MPAVQNGKINGLVARLGAYAELGRISNLPTTLSNVLVGASAGAAIALDAVPVELPWLRVLSAWIAIACFYMGGMAMNDLFDETVDRLERPQRPIPSGRISRRGALTFIIATFIIGLTILALIDLVPLTTGAVLVMLIIAYNSLHQTMAASVILLGLARGGVYGVAASVVLWPTAWSTVELIAGAVAVYVTIFSLIARSETQSQIDRRRWLAVWLPIIAAVPAIFVYPAQWWWLVIPLGVMLAWVSRGVGLIFAEPPRTKTAVMTWISGMCLLDALYLTLLDRPWLALIAGACFLITYVAQRRIAGT